MPNPNTLDWIHYQDIQIPDVSLQQQYQQYFQNGQYSEALTLLTNNATQLQGKAFIANLINTISAGISELENKYNTAVPLFLSGLSAQYSSLINNFVNKGVWSNTVEYEPYNFVVYNDDVYMCIGNPPTETVPTDATYWLFLGLRGEEGAPGVDVNMRYQWNGTDTYNVNDLVVYGTNIYAALVQNTGVTPGTDDSTWGIFLTSTPGQIYVGTTAPAYPVQNTVWFETSVDPLTQSTTTPLIGQFYRYNTDISDWEPMYPGTLFSWIDGVEAYVSIAKFIELNITPDMWAGLNYTYHYSKLSDSNLVSIYPKPSINSMQYSVYNGLQLSINGQDIILTAKRPPTIDLPVIIKIQ